MGGPTKTGQSFNTTEDTGATSVSIIGVVDSGNSTTETLGIGEVFTGEAFEVLNYGIFFVSVFSDVASAPGNLRIEQSHDGTNWDFIDDEYEIPANRGKTFSINPFAKWIRVVYTNGPDAQTIFRLQAVAKGNSKPSSHRIQDSIIDHDDAELTKSVLTGMSGIDGVFENVKTYRGALQVDDSLVHKTGISEHIKRDTGASTTFDVEASIGDILINVASTTGFAVDDLLRICNTDETVCERNHFHITAISVGVSLTLDRPLDNGYAIGDDVIRVQIGMNVTGTLASPISFKLEPVGIERWQITRALPTMLDDAAMDDGKFGGLSALTNGLTMRTVINGVFRTLTIWKLNGDLKDDMYDVSYSAKAPAGQYGLSGRWTFTKGEFVVDLDGATGDYLEVLVQDDLSGLIDFEIKCQGRLFAG